MTFLVIAYVRVSYWLHRALHGACEKREIRAYHTGYLRAIQDEQSKVKNALLESQLREAIRRAGW